MEMEEHSPGQGKPAKLPTARCERQISHIGAWSAHGTVWDSMVGIEVEEEGEEEGEEEEEEEED